MEVTGIERKHKNDKPLRFSYSSPLAFIVSASLAGIGGQRQYLRCSKCRPTRCSNVALAGIRCLSCQALLSFEGCIGGLASFQRTKANLRPAEARAGDQNAADPQFLKLFFSAGLVILSDGKRRKPRVFSKAWLGRAAVG